MDGRVDLDRIAQDIATLPFADGRAADIICLQEVSRHFHPSAGTAEPDQATALANRFPDHAALFRPAVDLAALDGSRVRRQFGCMVLSRYPILQVFNHLLTRQGVTGKSMQRQLLEVVLDTPVGPCRVATTHLEFNAQDNRLAQVAQIRALHAQSAPQGPPQAPRPAHGNSPYDSPALPDQALVCGDFNFTPAAEEYALMDAPFSARVPAWHDAWRWRHPDRPHPPTCGLDTPDAWPQGPHCRDFIYATTGLLGRLTQLDVDTATRASDHQPVFLSLSDAPAQPAGA